jgi:O-antigen/teichoic acid export membrane protein
VAEVAFYTVPAGVVARLGSFAGMACVFLVPRLAAATAAGQDGEATRLASRATRLGLCLTVAAAAPLVALAPELLSLWLGPTFVDHSTLAARILLVGIVVNVSVYGPHSVIRARGHAATLPVMYALELPVFALALWLLVPPWGVVGAAWAWAVRVGVDALAQHLLARRALRRTIVPLALPALVALGLGAFALACHWAGAAALVPRTLGGALVAGVALALLTAEDRDSLRRALWLSPTGGAA